VFIEPFAGGGIVSLTAVFEKLVDQAIMVELDDEVAAVWHTILSEDWKWLANRVASFEVTPESVRAELTHPPSHQKEKAFQTLLKNRVNRGGILAPGTGLLRYGENGKGLRSRWYPSTLSKRIASIALHRDRISFIEGDGLDALQRTAQWGDAVFFLDPPYTAAGKKAGTRLYKHSDLDHEELFRLAGTLVGDFLMTYDSAEGVQELAARHGFDICAVPMKTTHHALVTELLIGRNLTWARGIGTQSEVNQKPRLFERKASYQVQHRSD
jgi:DNA adenine methylase